MHAVGDHANLNWAVQINKMQAKEAMSAPPPGGGEGVNSINNSQVAGWVQPFSPLHILIPWSGPPTTSVGSQRYVLMLHLQ